MKHRLRRVRPVAVSAALMLGGALTASSCATFTEQDVVASSGGQELDEATLAEMLESPVAPQLVGPQLAPLDGVAPGEGARGLINLWVGLRAIRDAGLLAEAPIDSSRQQLESELGADWTGSPASMQDLLVDLAAVRTLQQEGAIAGGEIDVAVREADISVSPRYGRWDDELLRVEPLG